MRGAFVEIVRGGVGGDEAGDLPHFGLGERLTDRAMQVAVIVVHGKGNRNLAALDGPLDANDGRMNPEPVFLFEAVTYTRPAQHFGKNHVKLFVRGERRALGQDLAEILARAKASTHVPVAIGFGISTPAQALAAAEAGADGVIVGTRLVRAAGEASDPASAVGAVVGELAAGLASTDGRAAR